VCLFRVCATILIVSQLRRTMLSDTGGSSRVLVAVAVVGGATARTRSGPLVHGGE
jgi:hypothetical protein